MPALCIHIFGTITISNKLDSGGFSYLIAVICPVETADMEPNHNLSNTGCRPNRLQGAQIEYIM